MEEDQRLNKVISIKNALAEIEKTILEKDKLLSLVLENELTSNEEKIKNATWSDCKSGLCPIDWIQRYPEKEFINHMVMQDTLIKAEDILNKNLTMRDIEMMLMNEEYDFKQLNNTRGDVINERSRRWSVHDPVETYKCDSRNTNLIWVTGGLAMVAVVLGVILMFIGIKSKRSVKKINKPITFANERARLFN